MERFHRLYASLLTLYMTPMPTLLQPSFSLLTSVKMIILMIGTILYLDFSTVF